MIAPGERREALWQALLPVYEDALHAMAVADLALPPGDGSYGRALALLTGDHGADPRDRDAALAAFELAAGEELAASIVGGGEMDTVMAAVSAAFAAQVRVGTAGGR